MPTTEVLWDFWEAYNGTSRVQYYFKIMPVGYVWPVARYPPLAVEAESEMTHQT